jgi:hypothetical protein
MSDVKEAIPSEGDASADAEVWLEAWHPIKKKVEIKVIRKG